MYAGAFNEYVAKGRRAASDAFSGRSWRIGSHPVKFVCDTFLNVLRTLPVMKMPKVVRKYCPHCKTHTEQKVAQNKKRSPSSMTYGSKVRARRRGRARGRGNMGRYSKPAISKFKMTGKKLTKKTDLRFECKTCKKSWIVGSGWRAKKVEFV